ncbi:Spo0E family sporulation regulatory protein-aspartic acid phosphatase [Paenibacillus sp. 8b26]|uniref:Spo0E family sporulation regulatory protein-aspartic acid phosphatase n=1 Tax=Paenibacillus sp. 8b26 TaxID=3424133 RepID=UPI003D64B9AD
MKKQEILRHSLEKNRQKLYDLQKKYGFDDARVLKQSMILDELINQYNRTFYADIKKPTA